MENISELNPELPAIESKQFRATVTLIWPYSSSARQFALLLAEPNLRLRRKNGKVRARFSGASAKAMATTGVGIGDEVVLSLRGAEFVKEGAVSSPGKSIEWELLYTHTVAVQVYRNGSETANFELVDAAPTPAPRSPVRRQSAANQTPALEFSSPAFLKRARLSDGPFFQALYDPLADETEERHDKKRRRKSYRDWKAWTYSARTPSPEKEDMTMEDELESVEASPSRAGQLPRTPISPHQPDTLSVAAGPLDVQEDEETEPDTSTDEGARAVHESSVMPRKDTDYYDLYAGPDEHPPSDAQYAFGGDTEVDTEVNTEEEGATHGELNADSTSTTEADTEEQEDGQLQRVGEDVVGIEAVASARAATGKDAMIATHEQSPLEVKEAQSEKEPVLATGAYSHTKNELAIAMPPPTLSTFPAVTAGLLTPIGQEPASPKLAPQDASNLPMPSPFPGEQDTHAPFYFGHTTTSERPVEDDAAVEEEQDLPSEASYIGETSFFSSIGSLRASVFHPNHESAFTPVRFTFGMDGAGFSRPMELSSPPPEAQLIEEQGSKTEASTSLTTSEDPIGIFEAENLSRSRQSTPESEDTDEDTEDVATANLQAVEEGSGEPEVIVLSSEEEEEDASESGIDSTTAEHQVQADTAEQSEENTSLAGEVQSATRSLDETKDQDNPTATQHSTAASAIVDLGSPSDNNSEADSSHEQQQPQSSRLSSPTTDQSPTMDIDSHSEFVNLEFATENAYTLDTTVEQTVTLTHSQEREPDAVPRRIEKFLAPVSHPSESVLEATDDYLQDAFPMQHASFDQEYEQLAGLEHYYQSDINMESIGDASVFQSDEFNTRSAPEQTAQGAIESASQPLITVSEDDQKVRSMDAISEPPARNTRSKAKTTVPSKKEKSPVSELNTQSRGPVTSVARSVVSPPRTRTRSTFSPLQESAQASPYSLRSQSRQFSPAEILSAGTSTLQGGPHKHASQRSVDSIYDLVTFQTQDRDQFVSSFQPSQELGASQGRYSDVAFVKDSEEESVRSEQSISTVLPPEDIGYMHHSDPVDRAIAIQDEDNASTKPPLATAPELRRPRQKTRGKNPDPQVIVEVKSSSPARADSLYVTQPLHSSPGMQQCAARSKAATNPSLHNMRRTRRKVYELSPGLGEIGESAKPKASQKLDEHTSFGEGESGQGTVDIDELMRSSPPASPRIDQRAKKHSKKLITPNVTQETAMESQSSFNAHHGHDTLLTPQLTQTTSSGLRSFQSDNEADMEAVVTSLKPKTTPCHKQTSTATSSTLINPSSDDVDSDTPEEPSVGLSTPLGYYTPLKDLLYFLNRSSQFHSAANPDILALVTSPTTASEKAKKGPKHWSTTLQITDASSWPQTTTVQIFRAYQSALPEAQMGDVILLHAFAVKSLNRHPTLVSADESSWCVWRWGKPVWGAKRGAFGELRAREETKGPAVERGEGEWREVDKLRGWYTAKVQRELIEREEGRIKTRSKDKGKEVADLDL